MPLNRRADFLVHLPGRRRVTQDTTVLGAHRASDSAANSRRRFFCRATRHADEDEPRARVLIAGWLLATGRPRRPGAAPASLSDDELISFWADDQMAVSSPAEGSGWHPAAR